jgi:hypothetical protein
MALMQIVTAAAILCAAVILLVSDKGVAVGLVAGSINLLGAAAVHLLMSRR